MKAIIKYSITLMIGVLCIVGTGGCQTSASVLKTEDMTEITQDFGTDEKSGTKESSKDTEQKDPSEKTEPTGKTELIYVDLQGAVKAPGVYQLPAGSRIFQAIEMAGGVSEDAAADLINQAEILEDGRQIRIYTEEEAEKMREQQTLMPGNSQADAAQVKNRVNINQADKETLMTLTGIGETRAEAILAFREANGGFSGKEDLMQVEGIKEKTYEKLKDEITVN